MEFRVEPEGSDGRRFQLVGELDMATAPTLLEAAGPKAAEAGDLELDLQNLSFIDSSGIRALLVLADTLGQRGNLILFEPAEAVDRTLRLVGIERAGNIEIRNHPSS